MSLQCVLQDARVIGMFLRQPYLLCERSYGCLDMISSQTTTTEETVASMSGLIVGQGLYEVEGWVEMKGGLY